MAISVLILVGLATRKRAMLGIWVGIMLALLVAGVFGYTVQQPDNVVSGRVLMANFLGGIAVFLWREHVRLHPALFVAAVIATGFIFATNTMVALSPLFTVYITVYLGFLRLPRPTFLGKADLSYGIYLYGFPVQQMVMCIFPNQKFWWFNLLISIPVAGALAFVSWHLVEKPTLSLKRHLEPGGRLQFLVDLPSTRWNLLAGHGVIRGGDASPRPSRANMQGKA